MYRTCRHVPKIDSHMHCPHHLVYDKNKHICSHAHTHMQLTGDVLRTTHPYMCKTLELINKIYLHLFGLIHRNGTCSARRLSLEDRWLRIDTPHRRGFEFRNIKCVLPAGWFTCIDVLGCLFHLLKTKGKRKCTTYKYFLG